MEKTRLDDMVERYGEICSQQVAAKILGVVPRTIGVLDLLDFLLRPDDRLSADHAAHLVQREGIGLDGQGGMNGPDAIVAAQVRLCLEGMEIAHAAGLFGDLRDQHEHLIGDGEWRNVSFHGITPLSHIV